MPDPSPNLSYKHLLTKAWPIILANASVPLLGLADTTIMGRLGSTQQLGALAICGLVFSFVYWSFGFLRMGTTGFTAQAAGQHNEPEVRATLLRALICAFSFAALLVLLHPVLRSLIFQVLTAGVDIEQYSQDYFNIRIYGAPATLATIALFGSLIGLGQSKTLLGLQVLLNGLNIALDIIFAAYLDMGIKGIAIGTLIAEYITLVVSLIVVYRLLRARYRTDEHREQQSFWPWQELKEVEKFFATLKANSDIMIRTLFLITGFAWFNNQSAVLGDEILAANHILLQFISFSAFFLDGYAFVVEAYVGKAVGARNIPLLHLVIKRTSILACITAALLALILLVFGNILISALTTLTQVQALASGSLLFCVVYVFLSFAAFQLDGIFIGALGSRQMRNASIVSTVVLIGIGWPLTLSWGNTGLWLAFIVYVCTRAITLYLYFPSIIKTEVSGGDLD